MQKRYVFNIIRTTGEKLYGGVIAADSMDGCILTILKDYNIRTILRDGINKVFMLDGNVVSILVFANPENITYN
jgi:hypothetical protein